MTEPCGIDTIAPDVMSFGAAMPGTSAVVTMMSDCLACCAMNACSASR